MASSNKTEGKASSPSSASATEGEDPAKKHGLLYRMAPPKGGTDPPDAKFLAVAAVVCSAGFYAWFIDPPEKQLPENENR